MKKYFMQGICLLFLAATIVSCSNKNIKEAKYIPKEASSVMITDASLLANKLDNGNISLDSLLKKVFNTDSAYIKTKPKFDSLKNCGINWRDKFCFFTEQQTFSGKGTLNFLSLLVNITDSAQLRSYIQSIDKRDTLIVKKDKNFSYFEFNDNIMVSWNKTNAIVTFLQYTPSANVISLDNSTIKVQNKESINKIDELKKEVSRYYDLKEKESIGSVKIFTEMFTEKADGYLYKSTTDIINALSALPMQIPKLEELLQNNYSVATFNFDNGKIVGKTKTYTNATLSALLKKYAGPTVNLSMIEHFPSQNIDGFFLASFNPEIFNGILKELEVESLVNGFIEKNGFNTNDIYKCLKGDIAVVVSDFTMTADPRKKPSAKLIINAPVADKISLNKVLDKAVEAGLLAKKGNTYTENNLAREIGLLVRADDKNFTIASDSLTYQQYLEGIGKAKIANDIIVKIKGKAVAGYIDMQQIFNSFDDNSKSDGTKQLMAQLKATFKDIIFTSANFNGSAIEGEYEIRLKDEKQNSLATLLKLIPNISSPLKQQETVEDIKNLSFLKLIYLPVIIR
ncbi:MAG: DUF4836 family protein [Sphingobacteriia bacterium]|nr:DUF4836 family protein [Sphingobacteriia bacterium]